MQGAFYFGIAFWLFMAVAAVAGIVSEYKKRQLELEPLRAAIERGQQLDPAPSRAAWHCSRHEPRPALQAPSVDTE